MSHRINGLSLAIFFKKALGCVRLQRLYQGDEEQDNEFVPYNSSLYVFANANIWMRWRAHPISTNIDLSLSLNDAYMNESPTHIT